MRFEIYDLQAIMTYKPLIKNINSIKTKPFKRGNVYKLKYAFSVPIYKVDVFEKLLLLIANNLSIFSKSFFEIYLSLNDDWFKKLEEERSIEVEKRVLYKDELVLFVQGLLIKSIGKVLVFYSIDSGGFFFAAENSNSEYALAKRIISIN